jgi:hypothetical protein
MDPAKRFMEYAIAFEQTYKDDDWERLKPHFAEGAVYTITGGPPLGGSFEGRDAAIAHLRNSVNEFDRKFEVRRVELVGEPKVGADSFEMRWRATYENPGCPGLVFDGTERATFENDLIVRLEDTVAAEDGERIQKYQAEHLG